MLYGGTRPAGKVRASKAAPAARIETDLPQRRTNIGTDTPSAWTAGSAPSVQGVAFYGRHGQGGAEIGAAQNSASSYTVPSADTDTAEPGRRPPASAVRRGPKPCNDLAIRGPSPRGGRPLMCSDCPAQASERNSFSSRARICSRSPEAAMSASVRQC